MSFSSDVKAELAKNISNARHCRIAELSAMISMTADISFLNGLPDKMIIVTERSVIARTISTLIKKLFDYTPQAVVRRTDKNNRIYKMLIDDRLELTRMLETLKMEKPLKIEPSISVDKKDLFVNSHRYVLSCQDMRINRHVVWQDCCKREFLKGVFMTSGSVSNPEKGYHLEIVCDNDTRASFIENIIRSYEIEAKRVIRKKYSVVYIKDGTMIVDMLNLMGAYISLMDMENVRIKKEIKNNVNRRVNCETANIKKTTDAAVKQRRDIELIIKLKGIRYLPDNLRELAEIRLEAPDASLKELGEMMNPPMGKSGVNHRLRKIGEIADGLR